MSTICLIDTSIFLNLLNVPNRNQSKTKVAADFETYIQADCRFLLPVATILETGNHISQNGDGTLRRKTAQNFVKTIKSSFSGDAPWTPIEFPTTQEIDRWLDRFPDLAGQNKAPGKQEGTSFGDLSIIQEFQKTRQKFAMSEIFIWSLDADLTHYHHRP